MIGLKARAGDATTAFLQMEQGSEEENEVWTTGASKLPPAAGIPRDDALRTSTAAY